MKQHAHLPSNRMTAAKRMIGWFILLILLALYLSACSQGAAPAALTPVTMQLSWTHQAQFAGFYAADAHGEYAAEGLAVTFIQGGPSIPPSEQVLKGAAQFGVTGADLLILARANGKPLQGIAALYRRSLRV